MSKRMLFPPKNKSKFCMSFKQREIPVYNTMEEWLMDDLKIPTRSDVYKASLKNLYHQRKQVRMELA